MCCLRLQTSGTPAPCLLVNLHRHLRLLMYSSLMKSFFLGFSACKHGHFPMAPWPHGPMVNQLCRQVQGLLRLASEVGPVFVARLVASGTFLTPCRRSREEVRRGYPATWGIWMDPTIVLAHVYNMYIFMIMFVYN